MKRILMLLLLATTVAAQREAAPPIGEPKNASIPRPRRFALESGVDVAFVQWGSVPRATVAVVVNAGSAQEAGDQIGMAALMVTMMKQGTATRDANAIARELAMMGGMLESRAEANDAIFVADVFSDSAPAAAALIGDIVRNPSFPSPELARIAGDLEREMAVTRSIPEEIARAKFESVLYGQHPYGRPFPPQGALASYTLDQVKTFHRNSVGPGRTTAYVVGRFDEAAVEAALRGAFRGWTGAGRSEVAAVSFPRGGGIHFVARPASVQSTIIVGAPTLGAAHRDAVPLTLMNTLLGGAFTSRIMQNLREQHGYSYAPRSAVATLVGAATWDETADVTTNVTGASVREILREIERLGRETPSADEVQRMKNLAYGNFVRRIGTRRGIAEQLAFADRHRLGDDYLANWVPRLFATTPEDVQRIARETLRRDLLTIVIVGDRDAVLPQIREFGEVVEE